MDAKQRRRSRSSVPSAKVAVVHFQLAGDAHEQLAAETMTVRCVDDRMPEFWIR
jgi:hypothetical protein